MPGSLNAAQTKAGITTCSLGSKVREDQTLAMLLGNYWKNFITQGRGTYHYWNAFKDGYKTLGVDMINYYDLELRESLSWW